MSQQQQQPQLQFLSCLDCNNRGKVNRKWCDTCQGMGLVAWNGKQLLYWGKRLNKLTLARDRSLEVFGIILNATLFVLGIGGILLLAFEVWRLEQSGIPPWTFWKQQSMPLLGFWLSFVADGYLYYRFQRDVEKIKHIPKRPYEEYPAAVQPITWQEARTLPRKLRVDISEYYSPEARLAITRAWQYAAKYGHMHVNPIHVLVALLSFTETSTVFSRLGIPFTKMKGHLSRVIHKEPRRENQAVVLSPRIREVLFESYNLAWQLRQPKVGLTEVLESLVAQENEVQELLYDLEIDLDKIRNVVTWLRIRKQLRANWHQFRKSALLRPRNNLDRAMTAIATPALNAFSKDLTQLAQGGYLLPCIGREKETNEIFRNMHGGTRRSALLIGSEGVGKTTIVEGIAQRMVEENVPAFLQDKRLVSLDIARIVSGVDPSEAQQRLLIALNEIVRSGNIILVIHNIHTMIGVSAGREGSIDLAGVLAQALQSGSVLAVATTTPENYRRYIEHKSVIDSVFEAVKINEVTGNEAIQILEAKVGALEHHHQIFFSYDSIAKTVELSDRYIYDRMLPEKAIEVLQEVATQVRSSRGANTIVTDNDVAALISSKTNIPLGDITQEESSKLLNLEDLIHQRVVNQEEAVSMVASSLRRARAEMRSAERPIVNLLFLGPTGVGKTELAKTVSEVYFGSESSMVRLDMSEYQEKSSVNRLIGAPPGFGSNEGGQLTDAIRSKPFSLVLLDEIEKAHPDILNIFLQVLDDGRLTDSQGRTVDFTNAIIIATSNAATRNIQEMSKQGKSAVDIKNELLNKELYSYFRPEFLNRFDGIVIFKPLSIEHVEQITQLMLKSVTAQLEERGILFKATPEGVSDLARKGYSEEFGARSLRRVIQQDIQDALAKLVLSNSVGRRDVVILDKNQQLRVEKAKPI